MGPIISGNPGDDHMDDGEKALEVMSLDDRTISDPFRSRIGGR